MQEETGQSVEIANLDELLGSEIKGLEKSETDFIQTEKGSMIDDILRKYSEHIERDNGEQQKEKGH